MDVLEKEIVKKPDYGIILQYGKELDKAPIDNELCQMDYETEKKRIEHMRKKKS